MNNKYITNKAKGRAKIPKEMLTNKFNIRTNKMICTIKVENSMKMRIKMPQTNIKMKKNSLKKSKKMNMMKRISNRLWNKFMKNYN